VTVPTPPKGTRAGAGRLTPVPSTRAASWSATPSFVRPRPRRPVGAALRAAADGLLAALALVVGEAFVVSVLYGRELAGGWQVRSAFLQLVPLAWAAAAPLALAGAVAAWALRRAEHWRRPRVGVAAATAVIAAAVGAGVTTGRHFEAAPLRVAAVALFAGAAGALAWVVARPLGRALRERPLAVAVAALVLVPGLAAANALVLPRLYPAFHAALAALTVAGATLLAPLWAAPEAAPKSAGPASRAARPSRTSGLYEAAVLTAALAAFALAPFAAARLATADNLRFVFGERAPTLRYAVLAGGALSPPPEAPADAPGEAAALADPSAPMLDLRGRDVVLISIDALRADHVGAYGYARPVTPHLDALAAEGVRFSHAYCATPHTSYSVASMMTGKYMRPLLLQGAGQAPDTWAALLRTYRYRTAAFYPPAVFFIDQERFGPLRDRGLDFEYRRVEFLSADERARQVETYLDRVRENRHVFLWVHLFEPHEPYERHPESPLGDRDVDRYDAEIAAADAGLGKIVAAVRARRPNAVFVVTADHGEEFDDHGGRYHGTSVYEEQVRVPLVVVAPGLLAPRVVPEPVQTVDLLPTVLSALDIPRPARVRGRDLGPWLVGRPPPGDAGFAFAETDEATLLAEGPLRLVCARRLGACKLFDVDADPAERADRSAAFGDRFEAMRKRLRDLTGSHGRYELAGLRAEGKAWPEALRRGLAGDGDAAIDVAALLDDADPTFRRKAAEVLFDLGRREAAPALRLALTRDEDEAVRRWCALALTRLGEGVSRTLELVEDPDPAWRRLAALALAEAGDGRGAEVLTRWWAEGNLPHQRAVEVVAALGRIKAKDAAPALARSLPDVRLRPHIADALAQIGETSSRYWLLEAFSKERYLPHRPVLARALVALGAGAEMAAPLARFMGAPDPPPDALAFAEKGGFVKYVGGPDDDELPALRRRGPADRVVHLVVPPRLGRGDNALRFFARVRTPGKVEASLHVGKPKTVVLSPKRDQPEPTEIDPATALNVPLPPGDGFRDVYVDLPPVFSAPPGHMLSLVVHWGEGVELSSLAVVPLSDELPPPPPEPWTPTAADRSDEVVDDGT
jgi:arylsulfatase A-like enzyme